VKDEANFDKFDRAFAEFWQGVRRSTHRDPGAARMALRQVELKLSEEEKKQIRSARRLEKLMETLKQRSKEQKGRTRRLKVDRHAGTSPFGAYGYNPRRAHRPGTLAQPQRGEGLGPARVRNLDDSVELGTRNIRSPCGRLRKFAREGAPTNSIWQTTIDERREKPISTSTCGRSAATR